MCFANATNKPQQSAPSFQKTALSIFSIEERLLRVFTKKSKFSLLSFMVWKITFTTLGDLP